ncbi:hypothetical protein [Algibacter sp. 2305UL17-15]|uniref:hypothetical protein n=1 Tax=Algibacter sp. 2305UL17-15 TaxID=3231268 RepID=UPI00345B3524
MAHQMLKGYSFLLYFLMLIASFFAGLTYAGIVGAGKNQGLAGGAIVLGYGVMGAVIGLVVSLIVANKAKRKIIIWLNVALAVSIVCFWGYYHMKYLEKQKAKALENQEIQNIKKPKKKVPTATVDSNAEPTAMLVKPKTKVAIDDGLGMFIPNLGEENALYFYGHLNFEKSTQEHFPIDSITFKKSKYGGFEIATAPPWLVPDHLKLDYDMLYFRVQSVSGEFVEVTVNTVTNQTSFVHKYDGKIQYWPEFLLGVHSVEFLNSEAQAIYVKPLDHAGKLSVPHRFMKPLRIANEWMLVTLLDDNFDTIGKGWIKWIHDNKLLISYSLLS